MVRDVVTGAPANYRDASNAPGSLWRNPPTPIQVPIPSERSQRPFRAHDNPYSRVVNNLHPRPGNPNVGQTILAKAPERRPFTDDSRPRKRARHASSPSTAVYNIASSSNARGPTAHGNISEPDVQEIEPSHATNSHHNLVPNDSEIIDLGASSEDLGKPVSRTERSSPDPLNLGTKGTKETEPHAFETFPVGRSSRSLDKGKGRARSPSELVVECSEEDESIKEFTPPPPKRRQSNTNHFQEIRKNIVPERRSLFEGVKSIDLTTGKSVVSKMKRKDEGTVGKQRSTSTSDPIGTSSSCLLNPMREKEKTQTLPLEAWCFGHHLFRHLDSLPLKLVYDVAPQRIRVICGRSPPEKIEFKLDRDVCSVMIVNDSDGALKENVVIQFTTTQGNEWKDAERRYKGFRGGGDRGKDILTFLFSTAKDRGFSVTDYQRFVTAIRKPFSDSAVQIIRPSKGKSIWEYACRCAAMFEQRESRLGKGDRSESDLAEASGIARSVTPCSSTSIKTQTSRPKSNLPNGDSDPSASLRRSARQSAICKKQTSPQPLPPVQSEPDEVVLLYPPTGPGALSIMQSDLRRLQPEEYLNDTLIEFGLKLWLNDLREKDPALADQIHVFSSFFYKKLNNRKSPEDGYKSVRKWTSKIDLFAKKYVIVPINENIHWYLAIIYEPGRTLEPPIPLPHLSNARVTRKRQPRQEHANVETAVISEPTLMEVSPGRSNHTARITEGGSEADSSSLDATRATTPSMAGNEELDNVATTVFDKSCSITARSEPLSTTSSEIQIRDSSPHLAYPSSDGMDIDTDISVADVVPIPTSEIAETLEHLTSKPSSVIPVDHFYGSTHKPGDIADNEDSGEDQAEVDDMLAITQPPSEDLLPQTYIFTLDSLGTRHPQAIKVLKQYLLWEAKDKRNFDEVRNAVGKQVQVPVQPNSWDCGIYLLHFVRIFMETPSDIMGRILSTRGTMPSSERRQMWQDHDIPQYRDHLQIRIMRLSGEWKVEKTVREEANKRKGGDVLEVHALSSESEVDIVEDIPSLKATPAPRQKQPATRLRG